MVWFHVSGRDIIVPTSGRQGIVAIAVIITHGKTPNLLFYPALICPSMSCLLPIAIGTKELQILRTVVTVNAVDVVENERQGFPVPE